MQAFVIFADASDRREYQEDIIVHTAEACKAHKRELRDMGCEPVHTIYENESVYYEIKEQRQK